MLRESRKISLTFNRLELLQWLRDNWGIRWLIRYVHGGHEGLIPANPGATKGRYRVGRCSGPGTTFRLAAAFGE